MISRGTAGHECALQHPPHCRRFPHNGSARHKSGVRAVFGVAPAISSPVFFPVRATHRRQDRRRYVHLSPPGNFMESAQALRGACLAAKGAGTRAAASGQFGARIYSILSFAFAASVPGMPFRRPGRAESCQTRGAADASRRANPDGPSVVNGLSREVTQVGKWPRPSPLAAGQAPLRRVLVT
jgi:hypothetical protein